MEAALVSKITGRDIPYNNLPEETYAQILEGACLQEVVARILADADARSAQGSLFDDSRTLSRLIGRPTTPMADVVTAALEK